MTRDDMIELLRARGVADERVLAAMGSVDREDFVPDFLRDRAYDDRALPIEEGQTISQPFIVGEMAAAARCGPEDKVLEIGTGSGYGAAVLSRLCRSVVSIERRPHLADAARERLARLGFANVEVRTGDGTEGAEDAAPFDAIIVTAGGPSIPETLKRQLAPGGRLVIPVGAKLNDLRLLRLTRGDDDRYSTDDLGAVAFVPLVGRYGFTDWTAEEPS
ncbi:protein-L-isoaspartate(D-aspartate) O-methyltransferase [Chthonobacter albigriseus]|uniref:protein-L-isoaspartate(D-aspartate) O-methyltransferase n=1 Tax=Chthonobacter albigriseus TaxID=1683161 RepID=UPI0019D6A1F8|nr:protein-L-isoaspartate(D-aspartate) O-methyltransferase [Chthonobacter albigriseus]